MTPGVLVDGTMTRPPSVLPPICKEAAVTLARNFGRHRRKRREDEGPFPLTAIRRMKSRPLPRHKYDHIPAWINPRCGDIESRGLLIGIGVDCLHFDLQDYVEGPVSQIEIGIFVRYGEGQEQFFAVTCPERLLDSSTQGILQHRAHAGSVTGQLPRIDRERLPFSRKLPQPRGRELAINSSHSLWQQEFVEEGARLISGVNRCA